MNTLANEVHVWRAPLDQTSERLQSLATILTVDELKQADRILIARERSRFIAGRAILKTILGRYLKIQPADAHLQTSADGKLCIANSQGLCFNVSHSEGLALYAFTLNRKIGVDLEIIRPVPEAGNIVEWFFSPEEHAHFRLLPPSERNTEFFKSWTRKEAYLKAIGKGLAHPLKEVTLKYLDGEWYVTELVINEAHVAALAVEGPEITIKLLEWTDAASPDASIAQT